MDKAERSGITVLVVEDESLIRLEAVDMMEEAGYQVLEAPNAHKALEVLEHRDIAVLFTDIDMPGEMNGLELAAVVKQRWPHIALLVTSGHVRVRLDELPKGGTFFEKPYRAKQVAQVIDQVAESAS